MYFIEIRFEEEEREAICLKNIAAEQTLLEVCLKNGIQLTHECGGICSCSTCCIYILKGNDHLERRSVRENHLLGKKNIADQNARLSCQCLLLPGSGEIEVLVPKQASRLAP